MLIKLVYSYMTDVVYDHFYEIRATADFIDKPVY